jgi:hypothetical protein
MRTLITDVLAYSQIAMSAAPVPTDLGAIARVIRDLKGDITTRAADGGPLRNRCMPFRCAYCKPAGNALKFRRKDVAPFSKYSRASTNGDGFAQSVWTTALASAGVQRKDLSDVWRPCADEYQDGDRPWEFAEISSGTRRDCRDEHYGQGNFCPASPCRPRGSKGS